MIFEQPGVVEGVPAHGSALEQGDIQGLFQSKPLYDSMMIEYKLQKNVAAKV